MKQKNKLYLLILLVLACLVLLATGTYAAYTDTAYARRVVTTGIDTSLLPFSSNYLYEHRGGEYFRHAVAVAENTDTILYLSICNFPQKDNTKFSSSDITYTLDIEVVDKDGNTVNLTPPALTPSTAEYELPGGQTSTNIFAVTFTHNQVLALQDCFVRITASSTSGLSPKRVLAAEFKLVSASALSGEWKGRFTDEEDPKDLDAFNYEISGTGKGTLTVSWDGSYVTLSKWCREDLVPKSADSPTGSTTGTSTEDSISFSVDGENQTSYLLQFYRLRGRTDQDVPPNIKVTWVEETTAPEGSTP